MESPPPNSQISLNSLSSRVFISHVSPVFLYEFSSLNSNSNATKQKYITYLLDVVVRKSAPMWSKSWSPWPLPKRNSSFQHCEFVFKRKGLDLKINWFCQYRNVGVVVRHEYGKPWSCGTVSVSRLAAMKPWSELSGWVSVWWSGATQVVGSRV